MYMMMTTTTMTTMIHPAAHHQPHHDHDDHHPAWEDYSCVQDNGHHRPHHIPVLLVVVAVPQPVRQVVRKLTKGELVAHPPDPIKGIVRLIIRLKSHSSKEYSSSAPFLRELQRRWRWSVLTRGEEDC
jgi:hypothetical protein